MTMPPRGPRSVLWVVVVTKSAMPTGDGWSPAATSPAGCGMWAEHSGAGLQQGEVDGHVGLRARVRLDVGVLGAEQLLGAGDREVLDDVHDLAAAVVASPRVSLGVLVGQHRSDRLEDRLGH